MRQLTCILALLSASLASAANIVIHLDQIVVTAHRGDHVVLTGWVENVTGSTYTIPGSSMSYGWAASTTEPTPIGNWYTGTKPAGVYYVGALAQFDVLPNADYDTWGLYIGASGDLARYTFKVVPVPEPGSLLGLAPAALCLFRRRR